MSYIFLRLIQHTTCFVILHLVHTQKKWFKRCKNGMKSRLNYQSIMTHLAILIKSNQLLQGKDWLKVWWKFEHLLCLYWVNCSSIQSEKIKILSQFWLISSEIYQKFLCVYDFNVLAWYWCLWFYILWYWCLWFYILW